MIIQIKNYKIVLQNIQAKVLTFAYTTLLQKVDISSVQPLVIKEQLFLFAL